jgi:hypothetical protein
VVKRDAGQYTFFLCAGYLKHDHCTSFCETNPTAEQTKAAEELRSRFFARNRLKTLKRAGIGQYETGGRQRWQDPQKLVVGQVDRE